MIILLYVLYLFVCVNGGYCAGRAAALLFGWGKKP